MKITKYLLGTFLAANLSIGMVANAEVTAIQPDKNIGVYTSNQAISFILTRDDVAVDSYTYTIENIDKKIIRRGNVSAGANDSQFSIKAGTFIPGWYRLRVFDKNNEEVDIFASFTVVEKMETKSETTPFSVMLHGFNGMDDAKIPAYAEALGIVGFDTVRDGTSWAYQEQDTISKMVNPLTENGLKPLLTYEIPKADINSTERGYKGDLYKTNEMLRIQSKNYAGKVAAYEVINEPDLASENAGFSADVYSSFYKAAALGIEEGNPDSYKSFGGLANAAPDFADIMMQNDVADYVDSFNIHYHASAKNTATIGFENSRTKRLKNLAAIYGNNKPLWNTEAGMNSPVDENSVQEEEYLRIQAKYAITSAVKSISAYGTKNHTWFIARHYLENGANWGTASPENCTYPAFYSLSMLTRGLGKGEPIGELLGNSENVSGYFFNTGDNDALVLWNNSDATSYQQIKAQSGVKVKNLIGGTEKVYPSSYGLVNIPVTLDPVIVAFSGRADESNYIKKTFESSYVRDISRTIGDKVIAQAIWEDSGISVSEGRYTLTPGQTYNISVNLYNFNDIAVTGQLNIACDNEVEIVGESSKTFSIPAKGEQSVTTLNYSIKVKDDAENQYKGSIGFSGVANGSEISDTVCGYVVEHTLTRDTIGTITLFNKSDLWKDGNSTEGISKYITEVTTSKYTFIATFNGGTSRFWFPTLNMDIPADSDGLVLDIDADSIGQGTEMQIHVKVSGGSYAANLGDLELGKHTYIIPWKKLYAENGEVPARLDASKITKVTFGFQTRSDDRVKYTISKGGTYKLNESTTEDISSGISFIGITDKGIYKEGYRNILGIKGEFDNVYLNYEKHTGYTVSDDGAEIDLSKLEPGAYDVIVTKNGDFGKIDYEEITFCIKAKNDYKPDGTFY